MNLGGKLFGHTSDDLGAAFGDWQAQFPGLSLDWSSQLAMLLNAAAAQAALALHGAGPAGAPAGAGSTVLYAPDAEDGNAARAGGSGTGGSIGSTLVSGTTGSAFVIKISWDASVQNAPSAFTNAVLAAAQRLESQFTDAVTVNLSIGYGEVNGSSLGSSTLGASQTYLSSYSYSTLRNALATDATSTDDSSVLASLPTSSPVSGTFWTSTAEAKALGLAAANGTATDGFIGFSSTLPFTYSDSAGVAGGTYDFNGVALHEMTEVLGRMLFTGGQIGTATHSYDLLDLLHYSSAGVRDFSASTPGYFSVDGGTTNLGAFNTVSGGDAGDWASSMGYDAFDAFSASGVINAVSTNDLRELDAIGWNRAGVSVPTGVSLTPVTAGLAAAQTGSGLAANAALAKFVQTGGASGDTYSYTLGGAAAGSFVLSTANNAATLSAASTGVAGQAGGALFGLTVTATDQNTGGTSPANPLDVIVGSAAGDTINVASLSASVGAATPSFVYGLAGNDRIDATGMSGKLWLAGGAGADTMTGGSGANDYLYGAASDSTASVMDVITNFHAATDTIDLTGLSSALSYAGKIGASKVAAHSVAWQASGGNTFVYVNTSGGSESLTAANMKIELQGSVSLSSGNILHL